MTAKRFELIWETDEMCNVFDNDLDVNSTISVEDVVDLLNEQHETIEQLKKENEELKSEIRKQSKQCTASIQRFKEENEQLKKELFETSKELLWATSDEVDRALHYEDEVEELRKEIFGNEETRKDEEDGDVE